MTYRHTQYAPLCWLFYAIAGLMFALAVVTAGEPARAAILAVVGTIFVALAGSFHYLRVEDDGDALGIRFGPIPLFSKSIRYEAMTTAKVGRTTLLDGWGIHKSFRGGWVWNLWGYDCVVIEHGGKTHVGTDDAEALAEFLNQKIESDPTR